MSAHERWQRVAGQPEPTPIDKLSRPHLCARIERLRQVLDLLVDQMQQDGGESFTCRGRVKLELLALEQELFHRDHATAVSDLARDLLLAPLAVQLAAVRHPGEG